MRHQLKILICLLSGMQFLYFLADAQIITNKGDTICLKKGALLYINGDMNLTDNGSKYPVIINNNGTININGNFTAGANTVYTGKLDSVILSGTSGQVFPGLSYGNLLIKGGSTKNPSGNPFIINNLILQSGIIDTRTDTIRLDSLSKLQEDPNNYVLGNIITGRNLQNKTHYTNAGIGMEITANTGAPGYTTIFRKTGVTAIQHGFCTSASERYYDIISSNKYHTGADIVLHYLPWDLNGIAQSDLGLFRSDDDGISWADLGYTFRNPAQYTVSINAMDTLTRFTIGSTSNPLRNALSAGKPQTICSNKEVLLGGAVLPGHFYNWTSFPAGFTANVSNPAFYPKQNTTFYLKETVNTTSCLHIDSVLITVNPAPDSSWNVTHIGPIYTFKANDTLQAGYAWNFGDGNTSSGYKTSHVFAKDGIYKIKLVVNSDSGCFAESDSSSAYHVGINPVCLSNASLSIYPNPFSGKTNIHIHLQEDSWITLTLTDLNGKELGIPASGKYASGDYNFEINAATFHLSPGIYLLKTRIGNEVSVNRIINNQ